MNINSAFIQEIRHFLLGLGCTTPWSEVLLAASKSRSPAEIAAAYALGVRHFGENYVQEAEAKRAAFPADCTLHLIGPLQKNKVRKALQIFDVIQTVDSLDLAQKIDRISAEMQQKTAIYLQINLANEPQKAGILPENASVLAAACNVMNNLELIGLMAIPPVSDDPTPYFKQLKQLATTLNLPHVSMGMSADWQQALEQGSTRIRIGNLLFGKNR